MRLRLLAVVALAAGTVAACGEDAADVAGSGSDVSATLAATTSAAAAGTTSVPVGATTSVAAPPVLTPTTASPTSAAPASGPLDGQTYTASALTVDGAQRAGVNGSTFTVSFAGGRVRADAGCNAMSSDYRIEDGRLVAGPFAGTLMACEPASLMDQDTLMTQLLEGRPTVTVADGTLTLTGDRIAFTGTGTGTGTGTAAPGLDGRTFVADALTVDGTAQPAVEGTRVTIGFTGGQVSANAGCNTVFGAYQLDGGRLTVSQLPMTQMFCGEDRAAQDALISQLLGSGPTVTLTGDRLVLDGGHVRFDGLDRRVADPDRPLVGTTWAYNGLRSPTAVSIGRLEGTVTFAADGTVAVAACRRAAGTSTVDGDRVTIALAAPTGAACPDADAAQEEDQLLANLSGASTLTIEAGNAQLVKDDGNGVMLRAAS